MFKDDKSLIGSKPTNPGSALGFNRSKSVVTVTQDDGDGNWLISYADLMTLLFTFFVMLSAFSTPNAEKLEQLKQATAKDLGVKYVKPFEELSKSIQQLLKSIELENEVTVVATSDAVKISSKGTLFFDSGSAELREKAQTLIEGLSTVLVKEARGLKIFVEGHTDDSPISSKFYPSNWELSSARAGTVVRLLESRGFKRSDMRPLGLADTEPLVPNRNQQGEIIPENQAENRRIVIKLQKKL